MKQVTPTPKKSPPKVHMGSGACHRGLPRRCRKWTWNGCCTSTDLQAHQARLQVGRNHAAGEGPAGKHCDFSQGLHGRNTAVACR